MRKLFLQIVLSLVVGNAIAGVETAIDAINAGDYEKALKELRPDVQRGDPAAQFELGRLFDFGNGVAQNANEAVRLYKLAAAQGNVSAKINLADVYTKGRGVTQSDAEATRWFQLAAKEGSEIGAMMTGFAYQEGKGVAVDLAHARKWFEIAATKGSAISAASLGSLLEDGEGGPKNLAGAVRWYRFAVAKDNRMGATLLGVLYSDGNGVRKSPIIAYALISQVTEKSVSINLMLSMIQAEMSRDDLSQARALALRMGKAGHMLEELDAAEAALKRR